MNNADLPTAFWVWHSNALDFQGVSGLSSKPKHLGEQGSMDGWIHIGTPGSLAILAPIIQIRSCLRKICHISLCYPSVVTITLGILGTLAHFPATSGISRHFSGLSGLGRGLIMKKGGFIGLCCSLLVFFFLGMAYGVQNEVKDSASVVFPEPGLLIRLSTNTPFSLKRLRFWPAMMSLASSTLRTTLISRLPLFLVSVPPPWLCS